MASRTPYVLTPLWLIRSPSQPRRGRVIGYLRKTTRERLHGPLLQLRTDSGRGRTSRRTELTGLPASRRHTGPGRPGRRRPAVRVWRWRHGWSGTPLLPGESPGCSDCCWLCSGKPHLRRKQEFSCSPRKANGTNKNECEFSRIPHKC